MVSRGKNGQHKKLVFCIIQFGSILITHKQNRPERLRLLFKVEGQSYMYGVLKCTC